MNEYDVLSPIITTDTVEVYPTNTTPKDACTVANDEGVGWKYNGRITEAWKKGNSVKRLGVHGREWMRYEKRIQSGLDKKQKNWQKSKGNHQGKQSKNGKIKIAGK